MGNRNVCDNHQFHGSSSSLAVADHIGGSLPARHGGGRGQSHRPDTRNDRVFGGHSTFWPEAVHSFGSENSRPEIDPTILGCLILIAATFGALVLLDWVL